MDEAKTGLHYRDDGRFISGIPRRDLTEQEVANLPPNLVRDATASGSIGKAIYTKSKVKADSKPSNKAESEAPTNKSE